ncbi:MAG: protein kinase [Acidobacteriota bacterium]|nr:MAG: protein kinase [Acidobacteriota bacterium]
MSVEVIGHYRIERKLGEGGMGQVFLAQDTILERKVAIKFLSRAAKQNELAQRRFIREAKAAAGLDHPFICEIHEIGEEAGNSYIVMEFVEGQSLAQRLKEGPLPLRQALRIVQEIAEALELAHSRGIVHRDLKPANVMLTPQGHVKVMDFGLAKRVEPAKGISTSDIQTLSSSITNEGTLLGTPAYMSPEQTRGLDVDQRSDVFSLGVILHELVTGNHPFRKPTLTETITSILRDPPPPLQTSGVATVSELVQIQKMALAKSPNDRYASVDQLIEDIRHVRERIDRKGRRLTWGGAVAAFALLLVVVSTTWWLATKETADIPAEQSILNVLITSFENQTGEIVFDGVVESALGIGLESAPFVKLYDRSAALDVLQKLNHPTQVLDLESARLIAHREGIELLITGRILGRKDGYTIAVDGIRGNDGSEVYSNAVTARTRDEVLPYLGTLAIEIREALGDASVPTPEGIEQETFTAASLEAAHYYVEGQHLQSTGLWREAIEQFRRATDLDPNMGRAYAGMGACYSNLGEVEESRRHFQEAWARIDRMTDREKYRTRGGYYLHQKDYQKAIAEYSALQELFPADPAGPANLPTAYFFARQMDQAVRFGAEAARRYPNMVTPRANFALFSMYAGDFEAADREAVEALKLNPEHPTAPLCQTMAAMARQDFETASSIYTRLASVPGRGEVLSTIGLADLELFQGRWKEGIRLLTERLQEKEGVLPNETRAIMYTMLAHAQFHSGNPAEALSAAESALGLSQVDRVLFEAAHLIREAGSLSRARELSEQLAARLQPEPQVYALLIKGEILLSEEKTRPALQAFEEAQNRLDTWLGRLRLGVAYLEIGAYAEAYSEFEQCLKRRGEATSVYLDDVPTFWYFPQVYYFMGCAQQELRSPAAEESFVEFLQLRMDSPQDPMVQDARLRLSRLAQTPG